MIGSQRETEKKLAIKLSEYLGVFFYLNDFHL